MNFRIQNRNFCPKKFWFLKYLSQSLIVHWFFPMKNQYTIEPAGCVLTYLPRSGNSCVDQFKEEKMILVKNNE